MATLKLNFSQGYAVNTYIDFTINTSTVDEANRRTLIKYNIDIVVNNWSGYSNGSWLKGSPYVSLKFGGQNISVSPKYFQVQGNSSGSGRANIASGSFYTYASGNQSVQLSVTPNITIINNQGTLSGSTTLNIPTIQVIKNSSFSINSNNLYVGNDSSIHISSPSSSRTHRLILYIGGRTFELGSKTGGGTLTFTVPTSAMNYFSGASGYGTLTLIPSEGDNSTSGVTVWGGSALKPTLSGSGSYSVKNSTSISLSSNELISGVTPLTINISGLSVSNPNGGSTSGYHYYVKSASDNQVYTNYTSSSSWNVGTIVNNSSSKKTYYIQVAAQNSFGYTSDRKTIGTIYVYPYSSPSAIGSVSRNSNTQTTLNTSISYKYHKITNNSLSVTLKGNGKDLETKKFTSNGTWSPSITNIGTNISYEVKVTLNDGVTSVTTIIGKVGTEAVPIDLWKTGAGIGKIHSGGDYNLEVGTGGLLSEGRISTSDYVQFESNDLFQQEGMGGFYSPNPQNVGIIVLELPKGEKNMFSATINIRSYEYLATVEVGGYMYPSNTYWYSPQAIGNVNKNNFNVYFRSDGSNGRWIAIGDKTTNWGGYLQVTVENVKTGYGGAFKNKIGVRLSDTWSGVGNTTNKYFKISPSLNMSHNGHGNGINADMLDGKHASDFALKGEGANIQVVSSTPSSPESGTIYLVRK